MEIKTSFINFKPNIDMKNEMNFFLAKIRKMSPSGASVLCEVEKIHNDFVLSCKILSKSLVLEKASVGATLIEAKNNLEVQLEVDLSHWRQSRFAALKKTIKGGLYESA